MSEELKAKIVNNTYYGFYCSNCKKDEMKTWFRYCPKCGSIFEEIIKENHND